jgi:hypothetical protein
LSTNNQHYKSQIDHKIKFPTTVAGGPKARPNSASADDSIRNSQRPFSTAKTRDSGNKRPFVINKLRVTRDTERERIVGNITENIIRSNSQEQNRPCSGPTLTKSTSIAESPTREKQSKKEENLVRIHYNDGIVRVSLAHFPKEEIEAFHHSFNTNPVKSNDQDFVESVEKAFVYTDLVEKAQIVPNGEKTARAIGLYGFSSLPFDEAPVYMFQPLVNWQPETQGLPYELVDAQPHLSGADQLLDYNREPTVEKQQFFSHISETTEENTQGRSEID